MTKTILITDAASGFGRACAGLFAAGGWRLIINGRRRELLQSLADEHPETDVHIRPLDARDQDAVLKMLGVLPGNPLEVMPVSQNRAPFAIHRSPESDPAACGA